MKNFYENQELELLASIYTSFQMLEKSIMQLIENRFLSQLEIKKKDK